MNLLQLAVKAFVAGISFSAGVLAFVFVVALIGVKFDDFLIARRRRRWAGK